MYMHVYMCVVAKGTRVNDHIVVGTPGTLLMLLKKRVIDTRKVRGWLRDCLSRVVGVVLHVVGCAFSPCGGY